MTPPAGVKWRSTPRDRLLLFAVDLAAVAAAVVVVMLLRSALRDYDPLSADRLLETTRANLPVCLIAMVPMLLVCGRYAARADALEPRRAATAALLGAAAVSVWSLESGQLWWTFLPAAGAVAWTVALMVSGRLVRAATGR